MIKVKNAIILAAGRGSRLKHLTQTSPKPLLAPKGIRFIDGIISNLKEKGIEEIYVVTGYLSDSFNYLKEQNVKLIHNDQWDKGNNVTSIHAAINVLGDSLVINGDIIMKKNVFETSYPSSLTYVENDSYIDEWLTILDKKGNVKTFDKNGKDKKGFYQREIIFIDKALSNGMKEEIHNFDKNEYQEYLVIQVAKKLNIPFAIKEVETGTIFDLDTVEEFEKYKMS